MIVHSVIIKKLAKSESAGCGAALVLVRPSPPAPELATLPTKLRRLRRELTVWIKNGAKFVPKEVRAKRISICKACEYFSAKGNFGMGECTHPGCGCSKVKAALATSKCPHKPSKWPEFPDPKNGV